MSIPDSLADHGEIDKLLSVSPSEPDLIIDGIHFGRGDAFSDAENSTKLAHRTIEVQTWRIVDEKLEEAGSKSFNNFYSAETYIIRWKSQTDTVKFDSDEVLRSEENEVYFYWRGEDAVKGFSPLPEYIERTNPPVERIVQWSEPPAFLQIFSGSFIVHSGKYKLSDEPHLYILRGEMEKEVHLFEVEPKKENLRSRTCFVLYFPKEESAIIWHGNKSSSHCKNSIKKITEQIFGDRFLEVDEGSENEKFTRVVKGEENDYFRIPVSKIVDYTPRLFYFNKITGNFSVSEIECGHRSSYLTPFPFLQSHLYTADQPAIFLLDDNEEIWIWYGWQRDENDDFKSEGFVAAISYAKQKSKNIKKLVKVQKVLAGFEPTNFTNLFPVWKKRDDIAQIQEKDGVLPNKNPLIEVISHEV